MKIFKSTKVKSIFTVISLLIFIISAVGCSATNPSQKPAEPTAKKAKLPNSTIRTIDWTSLGIKKIDYTNNTSLGDNGGMKHTWDEYIPQAVQKDPNKKVPLVISLDGAGDTAAKAATFGFAELGGKENFITVCPQYSNKTEWNAGFNPKLKNDEDYLLALISHMKKTHSIDTTRIYITGHSSGGTMTDVMGFLHPEVFAGIIPMEAMIMKNYFNDYYPGSDPKTKVYYKTNPYTVVTRIEERMKQKPFRMATYFVDGTADVNKFIPVLEDSKDANGKIIIKQSHRALNFWKQINNIPVQKVDTKYIWGVPLKDNKTITAGGFTMNLGALYSRDDPKNDDYMHMVSVDKMPHQVEPYAATLAWDFIKRFSRNADGSLKVTPPAANSLN